MSPHLHVTVRLRLAEAVRLAECVEEAVSILRRLDHAQPHAERRGLAKLFAIDLARPLRLLCKHEPLLVLRDGDLLWRRALLDIDAVVELRAHVDLVIRLVRHVHVTRLGRHARHDKGQLIPLVAVLPHLLRFKSHGALTGAARVLGEAVERPAA